MRITPGPSARQMIERARGQAPPVEDEPEQPPAARSRPETDRPKPSNHCPECLEERLAVGRWMFCVNESCPRYEEPV